jgi:two-component system, CitB family, sensor kinase
MHPTWRPTTWSLARQLLALEAVVVVFVVLASAAAFYLDARDRAIDAARERVLSIARVVAASSSVITAVSGPAPTVVLQPYAERVRRETGTDFVVVMSTDRVRYTHPRPDRIGGYFVGNIDQALRGGKVLETYRGTLGPSERAVVPVRDDDGRVVALVSVGITRQTLKHEWAGQVLPLIGSGGLALALAIGGSALAVERVRRQTRGLGAAELGRMVQFYDAMLRAVREGVVLLDRRDVVQLVNDQARALLDLPTECVGRPVGSLPLPPGLLDPGPDRPEVTDEIRLTDNRALVISRAPAYWRGRRLGAVITLRDHTDVQRLSGELDSARGFAEALRSHAHESANRLHTVISLIELGRPQDALRLAAAEVGSAQTLADVMLAAIDEPVLAALLLGKTAEAAGRGVDLVVDPETAVPEGVVAAGDLVTVVGNLVDNAIEAVAAVPPPRRVEVAAWVEDETRAGLIDSVLVVRVGDGGPGLAVETAEQAFSRGWSSKPDGGRPAGRGLGLALVGQVVRRHGGLIQTGPGPAGGAVFTVRLPLRPAGPP